ncbi:hypothetical protein QQF64_013016 [Cirrhinus molitorella]|uniref:Uncharacterized protein n=1 Tax=Cirrhinus molitorella TaxID=172907 RepID=A0ABR3LR66_9TELE
MSGDKIFNEVTPKLPPGEPKDLCKRLFWDVALGGSLRGQTKANCSLSCFLILFSQWHGSHDAHCLPRHSPRIRAAIDKLPRVRPSRLISARQQSPCRTDPESCRGAKSPKLTSVFESDSPLPPQQQAFYKQAVEESGRVKPVGGA